MGHCCSWVVSARLLRRHRPRPIWASDTGSRLERALRTGPTLAAPRAWALPLGCVSGSSYPVDKWWPGLALNHLQCASFMPQHEELLEMVEWWGFHGEAGSPLESSSVHSARWQLDGRRQLKGVLQLRGKHTSMRQQFEEELGEEALGERSSPA
jgi:hypothetical protein